MPDMSSRSTMRPCMYDSSWRACISVYHRISTGAAQQTLESRPPVSLPTSLLYCTLTYRSYNWWTCINWSAFVINDIIFMKWIVQSQLSFLAFYTYVVWTSSISDMLYMSSPVHTVSLNVYQIIREFALLNFTECFWQHKLYSTTLPCNHQCTTSFSI